VHFIIKYTYITIYSKIIILLYIYTNYSIAIKYKFWKYIWIHKEVKFKTTFPLFLNGTFNPFKMCIASQLSFMTNFNMFSESFLDSHVRLYNLPNIDTFKQQQINKYLLSTILTWMCTCELVPKVFLRKSIIIKVVTKIYNINILYVCGQFGKSSSDSL